MNRNYKALVLWTMVVVGKGSALMAEQQVLGAEELRPLFQQWRKEASHKSIMHRLKRFFKNHGREIAAGSTGALVAALSTAVIMKKKQARAIRAYQESQNARYDTALQQAEHKHQEALRTRDQDWLKKIAEMEKALTSHLSESAAKVDSSHKQQLAAINTSLDAHLNQQQKALSDGVRSIGNASRELIASLVDENRRTLEAFTADHEAMRLEAKRQQAEMQALFDHDRAQLLENYERERTLLSEEQRAALQKMNTAIATAFNTQAADMKKVLEQVKTLSGEERAAREEHFKSLAEKAQERIQRELASRFEEGRVGLERQLHTQLAQIDSVQRQAQEVQRQLIAQTQAFSAAARKAATPLPALPAPRRGQQGLAVSSTATVSIPTSVVPTTKTMTQQPATSSALVLYKPPIAAAPRLLAAAAA